MKKTLGCLLLCCLSSGGVVCLEGCSEKPQQPDQVVREKEQQRPAAVTPNQPQITAETPEQAHAAAVEKAAAEEQHRQDALAQEDRNRKERDRNLLELDAQRIAEAYVRDFLNSPPNAEFPWSPAQVVISDDQKHLLVSNTVTAKNGLGAVLTHVWTVKLLVNGNMLKLDYCEVDGKRIRVSKEVVARMAEASKRARPEAGRQTKEDAKQEKLARREAAKEKAAEHRPDAAAGLLKKARGFKDAGNDEAYRKWLTRVATDYADTPAGIEAKAILEPTTSDPAGPTTMRKWSDRTGTRSIDAEFVSWTDGMVHLKRADGKAVKMPFDKLSDADQQFVRDATTK